MGALKLAYYPEKSPLKVVKGTFFNEEKRGSEDYRYGWGSHERVDEISGAGNHYTAEYWEYDSRTARRWNVDPVYKHHLSNYSVMSGNPILRVDPDGANDGEYEKDGDGNWQKTSTKGDDIGVDFYHTDGEKTICEDGVEKCVPTQTTYVTDRQGNWNTINNGRYALQGESRGNNVGWGTIYDEWQSGTGPERSVFEGNHPANLAIKGNYLYKNAFNQFQKSGDSKGGGEVNFWYLWDNVRTGTNMQVQMMGSYNASFYKLGDKTLSLIQDSKSRTSFYYHLPVTNYTRDQTQYKTIKGGYGYPDLVIPHRQESNTYQTYLFFR